MINWKNINRTDDMTENKNYKIDRDILTIKTPCGHYKFKIEEQELLKCADRIAGIVTSEIRHVDDNINSTTENLNQYARLLLVTLNICEKYIKLQDSHAQLKGELDTVKEQYDTLKEQYSARYSAQWRALESRPGSSLEKERGQYFPLKSVTRAETPHCTRAPEPAARAPETTAPAPEPAAPAPETAATAPSSIQPPVQSVELPVRPGVPQTTPAPETAATAPEP
ncbi:MAG: hypothetical protein HQK66_14100, partial [Desulfamplus sp.]|nr:hypothetical protein [Desulfamplus sp.]